MTFEEKLAARGQKMDELKAKLDEAVNARKQARQEAREELDAAFKEFEAAVEEQIDKRDAQIEKQLDEREAQVEKQRDKVDAAVETAKERQEQNVAKFKDAFTLDRNDVEALANAPTGIDKIQKGTEEQIARAKGDIATAKENARLVHEHHDSKCDAVKLRTQMKVNNAKEKVAARREAKDKAAQEKWILDLLDYAEGCYEMAYAWALEAEYTLMEAAYENDYYIERFCKEE
jgi:hypothetical protein